MIVGVPPVGDGRTNPKTLAPPTRPPAWSLGGPLICDRFPGVARHRPLADRPGRAGELPGNSAQAAPWSSGGAVVRPWGTGAGCRWRDLEPRRQPAACWAASAWSSVSRRLPQLVASAL